jgi:hypothetical protein
MKKLLFFIAILLMLTRCDMVWNKPGADPEPQQTDSAFYGDTISLKSVSIDGIKDSFIFLFRVPASDPDGDQLKFSIVSQPVRGMFSINALGDMYIGKNYLDKIQAWYGQKLEVIVTVTDGVNTSKATMTFIVVKSPDGRHFLKRDIA